MESVKKYCVCFFSGSGNGKFEHLLGGRIHFQNGDVTGKSGVRYSDSSQTRLPSLRWLENRVSEPW